MTRPRAQPTDEQWKFESRCRARVESKLPRQEQSSRPKQGRMQTAGPDLAKLSVRAISASASSPKKSPAVNISCPRSISHLNFLAVAARFARSLRPRYAVILNQMSVGRVHSVWVSLHHRPDRVEFLHAAGLRSLQIALRTHARTRAYTRASRARTHQARSYMPASMGCLI